MDIELHLPWPPTINSYYGHKPIKKRVINYIKAAGKQYRQDVEKAIVEQVGYMHLDDRLFVEVVLHPPDERKRDLDNYMKALLDACTHARLWFDDDQIDQLHIYRGRKKAQGSVTLRLSLAGPVMP
jgi:crossover junction endodeoxyribonuclease RusA